MGAFFSRSALLRLVLASVAAFMMADAAVAQYAIEWRQVGGPWRSGLYHVKTPQCVHGSTRAFCVEDFRGNYKNGEVTTFWVNGCEKPPIKIQCTVQPIRTVP